MKIEKIFITSFFVIYISFMMYSQTLINKITPANNYDIAYEVWELDNGLTIIVHEDDSDLWYVEVTYHVGSNREQIGITGFAHFFEHMMFQGSDNVGDDEHFKIISESGGTMNGTTNKTEPIILKHFLAINLKQHYG